MDGLLAVWRHVSCVTERTEGIDAAQGIVQPRAACGGSCGEWQMELLRPS